MFTLKKFKRMTSYFPSENNSTTLLLSYNSNNEPYSYTLRPGLYIFNLWGAAGGGLKPGFGAFVSGIISFPSKTNLYLYWWKRRRSKCHN